MTALWVFVAIWLVGLVGTFVPIIPATAVIFLGALLAGYLSGFVGLSWGYLALLGFLALAATLVDNLAAAWGAKKYGGRTPALWGAVVGSLGGMFFLPIGLIVGPLLGALIAELATGRPPAEAARSAYGTLIGILAGVGAKLALNILMGILVIWRLSLAG